MPMCCLTHVRFVRSPACRLFIGFPEAVPGNTGILTLRALHLQPPRLLNRSGSRLIAGKMLMCHFNHDRNRRSSYRSLNFRVSFRQRNSSIFPPSGEPILPRRLRCSLLDVGSLRLRRPRPCRHGNLDPRNQPAQRWLSWKPNSFAAETR